MISQTDRTDNLKVLETGNSVIDDEHRRLLGFIDDLKRICADFDTKQTCAGCPDAKVSACETALLDSVTELLGFMVDHFRKEENLMKELGISDQQHERYLQHAEDHANITERVAELTRSRPRLETVRMIADTAAILARWIDHHIAHHDVPMLH